MASETVNVVKIDFRRFHHVLPGVNAGKLIPDCGDAGRRQEADARRPQLPHHFSCYEIDYDHVDLC